MEQKNTYKVQCMFKPNGFWDYTEVEALNEQQAKELVEAEIEPRSWIVIGVELVK